MMQRKVYLLQRGREREREGERERERERERELKGEKITRMNRTNKLI